VEKVLIPKRKLSVFTAEESAKGCEIPEKLKTKQGRQTRKTLKEIRLLNCKIFINIFEACILKERAKCNLFCLN
jgi:hypothetical protein